MPSPRLTLPTCSVHNMQPADVNEAVLSCVLKHYNLELGSLCRLICCSSTTADTVHASCAGSLKVRLPSHPAQGQLRLRWLSKHGVLLGDLKHGNLSGSSAESVAGAEPLAGALEKAAALPTGLMLRSLSTCCLPVLRAASCSTLTQLCLAPSKDMLFPSVQKTAACITGLASQLHTLKLQADWLLFDSTSDSAQWCGEVRTYEAGCGLHSLLSQVLPQLTVLTCLEVEEVPDACIFKHAPPQLLELHAVGVDDQSTDALELGCLTSLTLLEFKRSRAYEQEGWRIIKAQDTLPPNLRMLRVVDCASATPLLRLTQLRELSIGQHSHMPAAELEQLSVLTQLEATPLGYDIWRGGLGEREVEKGSAGWGFVPALKELELHDMRIDPGCDLLQHLAGLSSLTRLVWDRTFLRPNMFPLRSLMLL